MTEPVGLECAIPGHLRADRTIAARTPECAVPPYPTYVARFRPSVTKVVMCYIGVQFRPGDVERVEAIRKQVRDLLICADGPSHWDESRHTDLAGYENYVFATYWTEPQAYLKWAAHPSFAHWWASPERLSEGVGYYREVFAPSVDGFETHFSTLRQEGVATLACGMSGEIREHAYWGSARDRIARAQTDALAPSGVLSVEDGERSSVGRRVRVQSHDNVCLIRSGQDWSDSALDERSLYDTDIRPHLEAGMAFLTHDGRQLGCYVNRFMRTVDAKGVPADKSYAMGIWRSLGDLEHWASHHPTHLAIFSAGVAYMRSLGPKAGLRTYHEISVVRANEQAFEYLNCHPRTGLLAAGSTAAGDGLRSS